MKTYKTTQFKISPPLHTSTQKKKSFLKRYATGECALRVKTSVAALGMARHQLPVLSPVHPANRVLTLSPRHRDSQEDMELGSVLWGLVLEV